MPLQAAALAQLLSAAWCLMVVSDSSGSSGKSAQSFCNEL